MLEGGLCKAVARIHAHDTRRSVLLQHGYRLAVDPSAFQRRHVAGNSGQTVTGRSIPFGRNASTGDDRRVVLRHSMSRQHTLDESRELRLGYKCGHRLDLTFATSRKFEHAIAVRRAVMRLALLLR